MHISAEQVTDGNNNSHSETFPRVDLTFVCPAERRDDFSFTGSTVVCPFDKASETMTVVVVFVHMKCFTFFTHHTHW